MRRAWQLSVQQASKSRRRCLVEAQGAVLPLVPYLDTLRWVFIAAALGGIAVAVWARVDDWRKGLR